MASRYKWYNCEIPMGIDSFYKILKSENFSIENGSWLTLEYEKNGGHTIRFYWTIQLAATSFDSAGEERFQSYPSISFQEFCFIERDDKVFVRLKNPGRNVTGLFNFLESIVGYGFWVEPVKLVGKISEKVQLAVDSAKLTGLKVANMAVAPKVVARFEFASKEGIEQKLLSGYLKNPYVLDFCAYEVLYKNVRGQISFYRNGQMKVSEQLAPFLLDVIEKNL